MTCPKCTSTEVRRSPCKSFADRVLSWLGRWPYRCHRCCHRFFRAGDGAETPQPVVHRPPPPEPLPVAAQSCTYEQDTVAQVVIRADDSEQMDRILLALHRAIDEVQTESRRGAPRPQQARTNTTGRNRA